MVRTTSAPRSHSSSDGMPPVTDTRSMCCCSEGSASSSSTMVASDVFSRIALVSTFWNSNRKYPSQSSHVHETGNLQQQRQATQHSVTMMVTCTPIILCLSAVIILQMQSVPVLAEHSDGLGAAATGKHVDRRHVPCCALECDRCSDIHPVDAHGSGG